MQGLEDKTLRTVNCDIPFYYRYVDDIILAAPNDKITEIVNAFNDYHDRLQFTVEYESEGSLSSMDLLLHVDNGKITLDWYHKETFSGRLLSFYSNHSICQKIGTIFNLIDRAVLLSHPRYHQKNIELWINLLLNNGYPLNIIFERIKKKGLKRYL